jgi:hypothetical protein
MVPAWYPNYKGGKNMTNIQTYGGTTTISIDGTITMVTMATEKKEKTSIFDNGLLCVTVERKNALNYEVIEYHYTPESHQALKNELEWMIPGTKVITKMAKATA